MEHLGHKTFPDENFGFFGNFKLDHFAFHRVDCSVKSALSQNAIATFQFVDHPLVFFGLFLLRSDEKEIEDDRNSDEWDKRH